MATWCEGDSRPPGRLPDADPPDHRRVAGVAPAARVAPDPVPAAHDAADRGPDPREHDVHHTDEIVERLDLDRPADLVGITAPTPSALHAYEVADALRRRRVPVVIGGPQPAPRWDLIKGRQYGKSVTIATRGCPHRCDYCTIPLLYGPGTMRCRPVEGVVARSRGARPARSCSGTTT
jgi:radical SAM superfamily enzyme YgiQ (UPF0313 family)